MSSILFRNRKFFHLVMNTYPPYWGSGISLRNLSADFRNATVQMKLRGYNRNAFGTHFGGSIYSMCDPWHALLLVANLGSAYRIWDKTAVIQFMRPARGTVTAEFSWSEDELDEIRAQVANGAKHEPVRVVDIHDERGEIVARVEKTLYVRQR